ncbi:MAG: hypothetical protein ACXWW0_00100 [Bacteroidia bacterium]
MSIKVNITPDPITAFARECVMKKLTFHKDLEMDLEIEIHEVNATGQSLYDVAQTMQGLTDEQRNAALAKHFPKSPAEPYTTRGGLVNSATGEVDPNGDITEREALFSITISQLKAMTGKTDADSAMGAIFEFVKLKMQEINQRGRN